MKCWLKNLVERRKQDKKYTMFQNDPVTGDDFAISNYDVMKYGEEMAWAKAKKKLEKGKAPAAEELPAKARAKASS